VPRKRHAKGHATGAVQLEGTEGQNHALEEVKVAGKKKAGEGRSTEHRERSDEGRWSPQKDCDRRSIPAFEIENEKRR